MNSSIQLECKIKIYLPDLFAYKSLLTWTTDWLYGSSDVDGPKLIVGSACLMFVKGWFADTDDRVDGWFTNAT